MDDKRNPTVAVGIDSVAVARFESWHSFDDIQLSKLFSQEEIKYARSNNLFFAQRLAVRFAAKEAFLKALQQFAPQKTLNFLTIAKAVSVSKNSSGSPFLSVDQNKIMIDKQIRITVSLTHEKCHATAIVILYTELLNSIF